MAIEQLSTLMVSILNLSSSHAATPLAIVQNALPIQIISAPPFHSDIRGLGFAEKLFHFLVTSRLIG
jgi:hypothetical protein